MRYLHHKTRHWSYSHSAVGPRGMVDCSQEGSGSLEVPATASQTGSPFASTGQSFSSLFLRPYSNPTAVPPHASSVWEQAHRGCRAFPASGQKGHVKIKSTWLYLQATKERVALPRKTFPCKRILNLPFDCHCWNDGFTGLKFKTLSASFLLAVIYERFRCWLSSKITAQQPWQTSRRNFTG